jgi:hypothetical protein
MAIGEWEPVINEPTARTVAQAVGGIDKTGSPVPRIGIALSGGGFRAALFHAGVLEELENLGIKPAVVSAVSGGAIIGAYYALANPLQEFQHLVSGGYFNLKRELVKFPNPLRLLLPRTMLRHVFLLPGGKALETEGISIPFMSTRLDRQAAVLDRAFLHGSRMKDLKTTAPLLLIGTTDLLSGQAVGMTPYGSIILPIRPHALRLKGAIPPQASFDERVPTSPNYFSHCCGLGCVPWRIPCLAN